MGQEVNLLIKYPRSIRNIAERARDKSAETVSIARKYQYDYFDGERKYGYGGYSYSSKFWSCVARDICLHYDLTEGDSVLDIGCAKGFLLYDLIKHNSQIAIAGLDISEYAIATSLEEVRPFLKRGDAKSLPYPDKSFDVVLSINTLHNLTKDEIAIAISEIERVKKKGSFISVDAYRSEEEKQKMFDWALTAETIMSVDEWKAFFKECNYTGDYYWFFP